jgi:PilZ domain
MDPLRFVLRTGDVMAVLGFDVTVRLVNVSGSGSLLRSNRRLHEGTTGSLRVFHDGVEYADHVRVVRCRQVEGSSDYHLGVEFLWTTAPGERSMRRVIAGVGTTGQRRD